MYLKYGNMYVLYSQLPLVWQYGDAITAEGYRRIYIRAPAI